ncbi:MAG: Indolepyruvate oxidoreductase subunit IorA [Methanocella sp. PtaU1.Bin125]|nr:MAG: Indolepyruvate oxidoreductase subunit IorA [Methanocella sp. PtaU1.Bin125]
MPDIMTGTEAARAAIEDAAVRLAAGVPGFPINGLFSALQQSGLQASSLEARWQFNEKIAFEMALGASACGSRAVVVAKHVGLNVMADPLVISATHGIGAGIVVIAGDDVGAAMSQNEQDSRWYGRLGDVPVYDPSTPGELYESIVDGIMLSEQISAPVVVRVTDPVLAATGPVNRRKAPVAEKKLSRDVWQYTMIGKRQRYLKDGWALAVRRSAGTPMNRIVRKGKLGIISSGYASVPAAAIAAANRMSHLSLVMVNPFPRKKVDDFVAEMDAVLVCEEASTFIESQAPSPKVKGRLTGHLPQWGGLDEQQILDAVSHIMETRPPVPIEPETMQSRGFARGLCPGCPFAPVYEAIKALGVKVASDVGCPILTTNPPYSMVDVACSLGSPASVASGFIEKGVAMLGDYGLLHTGLPALLNAKYNGYGVLAVVFVNGEAAMTGGQEVPDVVPLLTAVFGDDCIVADASGLDADRAGDDLRKLLQAPGLKVYAVRGACPPGAKRRQE